MVDEGNVIALWNERKAYLYARKDDLQLSKGDLLVSKGDLFTAKGDIFTAKGHLLRRDDYYIGKTENHQHPAHPPHLNSCDFD